MSVSLSPPYRPEPVTQFATSTSSASMGLTLSYETLGQPDILYVGAVGEHALEADWPSGKRASRVFEAHCLLYQWQQQGRLPHAIVTDPVLPDSQALDWRRLLQQDDDLREIPFLIIGEADACPDHAQAQALGVDDCFAPGAAPEEVVHRIQFLRIHKSRLMELATYQVPAPRYRMPWTKRLFDILMSGLLLLLSAPLMMLIAIRLLARGKGSIIAPMTLVGRGYQMVHAWAFRGAEEEGASWWLRLPLLWSVLMGDLSMVGNRPLAIEEAASLTTDQWAGRFLAPAGLTGPWWVGLRRQPPQTWAEQRLAEVAYSQQYRFQQDLYWLFCTLRGH